MPNEGSCSSSKPTTTKKEKKTYNFKDRGKPPWNMKGGLLRKHQISKIITYLFNDIYDCTIYIHINISWNIMEQFQTIK